MFGMHASKNALCTRGELSQKRMFYSTSVSTKNDHSSFRQRVGLFALPTRCRIHTNYIHYIVNLKRQFSKTSIWVFKGLFWVDTENHTGVVECQKKWVSIPIRYRPYEDYIASYVNTVTIYIYIQQRNTDHTGPTERLFATVFLKWCIDVDRVDYCFSRCSPQKQSYKRTG